LSLPLAGGQGVNAGADVAEKEEKRGQEGQARKATHRRAARKGHTLKRTLGNRKPRVRPDTWVTKAKTHGHTLGWAMP
jgi:hypothetical protein